MRARILRFLLAAITVSASMTRSASAAGVDLAWDDCGVYGTMLKTFSCNSNVGLPFMLYGSFVPPPDIDQFVGIAAQVDICTMTSSFVDWWAHGTGYCRGTNALFTSFDFTAGPFNCADPYLGQAAGGFAYDVSFGDVDRARMRIQCAVPFDQRAPVDPNTEYYAFQVRISRSQSTGDGSCAGCSTPACIILNDIQLFQPPEAGNDPVLTNPVNDYHVNWQATVPNCPFIVSVSNASWGRLKNLYR